MIPVEYRIDFGWRSRINFMESARRVKESKTRGYCKVPEAESPKLSRPILLEDRHSSVCVCVCVYVCVCAEILLCMWWCWNDGEMKDLTVFVMLASTGESLSNPRQHLLEAAKFAPEVANGGVLA